MRIAKASMKDFSMLGDLFCQHDRTGRGHLCRGYHEQGPDYSAGPDLTVRHIAELISSGRSGSVIIVNDMRPIGIVTERDLRGEGGRTLTRSLPRLRVRDIMTSPVVTIGPKESVAKAARKMASLQFRRLPVINEDQLIGMLTENDIEDLPILDRETREWKTRTTPAATTREGAGEPTGYRENCENFSYDLNRWVRAEGGPLLCSECRELFVKYPTE